MNPTQTDMHAAADGSTLRIVDVVLGGSGRKPPSRVLPLLALLVALTVHATLVVGAIVSRPSLESWSAHVALLIHQELTHTAATDLDRVEPPPPMPREPEPLQTAQPQPSTKHPTLQTPRPEANARATAAAEPSPPSSAGDVVTQDEESVVDLTATSFVTGSASSYAGGVTTSGANNKQTPSRAATSAGATSSRPASRAKPTRPVTLEAGEWQCPWPDAALSADIYQAFVVLRVTVDHEGRVEAAQVLQDPGYGFGAAAISCAKNTHFLPALDANEKPQRAISPPIRVRFVR